MSHIPAGTPYMPNAEVTTEQVGPAALCPSCHHATLLPLQATVLHDQGVVLLPVEVVCVSDDCWPDDEYPEDREKE